MHQSSRQGFPRLFTRFGRAALLTATLLWGAQAHASRPAVPPAAGAPIATTGGEGQPVREVARGIFSPQAPQEPIAIRLGAGYTLDPSLSGADGIVPPELRAELPAGDATGSFLVQFSGPIGTPDRARLEQAGARIVSYVPDYGFLVRMPGRSYASLGAVPGVVWSGLYHPAYKISPLPSMREGGVKELVLLLFPDASVDGAATEVAAAGARVLERHDNGINKMLRIEADLALLPSLASVNDVAWIEPHKIPMLHNNQCQWVVQTWQNNNRRVWDLGIRGAGQIISVCDSGIRMTHRQFYDASVPLNNFGDYPTHRKVIAYYKSIEYDQIGFGDDRLNAYHGTHTACTTAGDDAPNAADARDGMAINAKIFFLDGGGGLQAGIYVPLDLNDLMIMPYTGNAAGAARIITNSWGNPVSGAYDLHSMTADQFMWYHPDFLAFFSNGNDGFGGVGSPATAKNVVSAGGTGNGTNANQYYASTSRGPTDDGRYKPTICAPATLTSANGEGDTGYIQYSGTSMASPAMAGATALIREYLNEGWYPTGAPVAGNAIPSPSAALMKAMAINSADPDVASFVVPDNNIGWGRIDDDQVLYFNGDARKLALVENPEGIQTGEYVEYQVYVASNAIPLKAALVWTDYPGNPNAAVQLVNDLNLVATDGTNTYKGNVYSSGQSQTGGVADARNVEECVRRNTPTLGRWTFRIEGLNVPYGPQPFALVITGGLAVDQAIVTLDRATYGAGDAMAIRVVDTNAGASVSVTATSSTEPSTETVILAGSNGVYEGSISLEASYPVSNDGVLSVSNGDVITVTYNDQSPAGTLVANASVDLAGPAISNVHVSPVNEVDATVLWTTTSTGDSKVYFGPTPALGYEAGPTADLVVQHALQLTGLLPDQTYYYDVESTDNQGNTVRDDNGGLHYTFTTSRNRDVLLVIGDSTFDKKDRYVNAFARTGWGYTLWEGAQAATPYVGDLVSGMASYKAVVWQTGLEQYPMFSDAARDSVAYLMSLGSRLAVYSHDVAWDFCDPTSPDYTAARCQWFQNQLHATWQSDPTTFSLVRGIAGDPISGAYTSGVSYTPHRDGAAGDEIDGSAGNGTFAYVWRDNDASVDDIALRWTANAPTGNPLESVWGGTPNKVSSNFFEWAHVNNSTPDDATRADILDKTLIWLIGRDHPSADVTSPNGGEIVAGNTVSIIWTEQVAGGFSISNRKVYYSNDSGDTWNLIASGVGPSPYVWNVTSIPNGIQYRVRVVVEDNGSPVMSGGDASAANFTINRAGGDTRGPVVQAGTIGVDPNPIKVPDPAVLAATVTDVTMGNSNVTAAEWSRGANPAAPGTGTPMTGSFNSPSVLVTANLDSNDLTSPTDVLWVRGRDAAGNWGSAARLSVIVNRETVDVAEGLMPTAFALYGASPNPFGPSTTIRFDLPRPATVKLAVYDISGRKVRTLVDGALGAGHRSIVWDGRDDGHNAAGSGLYFYRMEAGAFSATRKLTLLK